MNAAQSGSAEAITAPDLEEQHLHVRTVTAGWGLPRWRVGRWAVLGSNPLPVIDPADQPQEVRVVGEDKVLLVTVEHFVGRDGIEVVLRSRGGHDP